MDPGTILAVIQLTGSVAKICGKYITGVKGATGEIESLQHELEGLKGVLQRLDELLKGPHGPVLRASQDLAKNIDHCHARLAALKEHIEPSDKRKFMTKLGLRALKWPLKRDEVERTTKELDRDKSLFLTALQIDQTYVLGLFIHFSILHLTSCLG